MAVERISGGSSLIDVLDRVLDKGIVIDAWVRISLVGIDLITVEARVVVASIDTRLGLAFQIIDDILDVTQTSEILGKSAGKDVAAKKATYPAVIGLEKSRGEARRLTRHAHNALSVFRSSDAEPLHALANYLLEREY